MLAAIITAVILLALAYVLKEYFVPAFSDRLLRALILLVALICLLAAVWIVLAAAINESETGPASLTYPAPGLK